jgi:ribulose-phosphate 3-epimerase
LPARALPPGPQVAPSILSADYARLGAAVEEVLDAGARMIHVDVMDGQFVPPITVGPLIVAAIAERVHGAGAVLEAHLMIERPEQQAGEFVRAGADLVSVHAEATPHLHRVLESVREEGALAGAAINPATPVSAVTEVGHVADLMLCMTVNPGWGGQSFIASSPEKVARLREALGDKPAIEVDGGIDPQTAPACADAGARVFVAGSAVFGAPNPPAAFRELAEAVGAQ